MSSLLPQSWYRSPYSASPPSQPAALSQTYHDLPLTISFSASDCLEPHGPAFLWGKQLLQSGNSWWDAMAERGWQEGAIEDPVGHKALARCSLPSHSDSNWGCSAPSAQSSLILMMDLQSSSLYLSFYIQLHFLTNFRDECFWSIFMDRQ